MNVISSLPLLQTGILPPLVYDYLAGKEQVRHLYNYTPDILSFKKAIEDKAKDKTNRRLLVEVLKKQHADIPTSPYTEANIQALLDENTFTVTAAHQPCLFMGPLYNIYKISGAINLAKQLKQHYPAFNFVPVFWMGSEDHDMGELNHTYINGKRVEWSASVSGAVGRVPSEVVQSAIDSLKENGFSSELLNVLEQGIDSYKTFGGLTQYFVNELFKEHGLVVLNQDDKAFKTVLNEVMADEVFNSRATTVLKDSLQFLETNYKVQAQPREINFFHLGEGYRERIVKQGDGYSVNNIALNFTAEELKALINEQPENFSPNVIFRPLYQEMLLPNLAFVGGSGELSYWLELKPLFDYYHVNFPALVMRNSAVIASGAVLNKLQKLQMNATDFFGDIEEVVKDYVRRNSTAETSLEVEKTALDNLFANVVTKAEKVDPTLKQSAVGELQKALNALTNLEGKMLKAEKRNQETAVNQLRSVHAALFPEGTLQERRENFMPYYSPAFIAAMVENLNPLDGQFKVFALT